jgi:hypothetical protein
MIMTRELDFGKVHELMARLLKSVEDLGRSGKRVDLVERELLQKLLEVGLEILSEYVASAGDGDEGGTFERKDRKLVRLKQQKQRTYSSIFGKIRFSRYVYGSRDKQRVEWVPLDAKLGMPAAEQSYVLEDLLQKLVSQLPYTDAVGRLEEFLGVTIGQRTAEGHGPSIVGLQRFLSTVSAASPGQHRRRNRGDDLGRQRSSRSSVAGATPSGRVRDCTSRVEIPGQAREIDEASAARRAQIP